MKRLFVLAVLALAIPTAASARTSMTCGSVCDGGNAQPPQCSAYWLGSYWSFSGYLWKCVANPYRWVIVG